MRIAIIGTGCIGLVSPALVSREGFAYHSIRRAPALPA
jgi:UDP-glucose 6-dehydrogenase